ncbi:hypothetical protein HYT55_00985 [Candidatus Woesearchaeota archaeon]|nr:hypothetical protein [Candidatus Woesearchaeota archaeon]
MRLSDLEQMLRRNYDRKQIDPQCRDKVLRHLRQRSSVADQDVEHVKLFTKVAKSAYLENQTDFDWHLVERLLGYHLEGIELGRVIFERTKDERTHRLYIHLAHHAVELIDQANFRNRRIPPNSKQKWLQEGLNLADLVAVEGEPSIARVTKGRGAELAFSLYFETGELSYAERGYQKFEELCIPGAETSETEAIIFQKRSLHVAKVLNRLVTGGRKNSTDLYRWAMRSYETSDPNLPCQSHQFVFRLYDHARAAEEIARFNNDRAWKGRALVCYKEFLEYEQEHREERINPALERHAREFINAARR